MEPITKIARLRPTGKGYFVCQIYAPKEWANFRVVLVPIGPAEIPATAPVVTR